jgi:hypothetical protein
MRFYFHIRMGGELICDHEGQDLPDASAARREAENAARECLADALKGGAEEVPYAFVIADERGREFEIIPFANLLPKPLRK